MTVSKASLALLVTASLAAHATAHPEYRERIPNAFNVKGVDAIGHVDKSGGGSRNAFGKDFDAADRKWTTALCQKDSDGDGQTNGQELGDPCCAWVQTSNAKVLWTDGVSAPGDSTSKSDPTLWASVTCPTESPASTTPTPSTGGTPGPVTGAGAVATTAAVVVALANVVGVFQ